MSFTRRTAKSRPPGICRHRPHGAVHSCRPKCRQAAWAHSAAGCPIRWSIPYSTALGAAASGLALRAAEADCGPRRLRHELHGRPIFNFCDCHGARAALRQRTDQRGDYRPALRRPPTASRWRMDFPRRPRWAITPSIRTINCLTCRRGTWMCRRPCPGGW